MSFKQHIIKERFDLLVTTADQNFKAEFTLDKSAQYLLGISVTSDRDDLLFYRGSNRIYLNEKELFPDGFESKLLMAGLNVAPDHRMITLGELPTGNGMLDVNFKDTSDSTSVFAPYRVTFYTYSVANLANER
jgi:hypothetical protein